MSRLPIALLTLVSVALPLSSACAKAPTRSSGAASQPASPSSTTTADADGYAVLPAIPAGHEVAILAGGCFWCMESDFEPIAGIQAVVSGYIGGHLNRPTYKQVSSRTSGHAEAIWVLYDPKVISYENLLERFWVRIDPTTKDRQFCDVGDEYRPEIFYVNDAQKAVALKSLEKVKGNKPFAAPIVVEVSKAGKFWTAESYHQDFYRTTPTRYFPYRAACGRDARLKELWGARYESKGH